MVWGVPWADTGPLPQGTPHFWGEGCYRFRYSRNVSVLEHLCFPALSVLCNTVFYLAGAGVDPALVQVSKFTLVSMQWSFLL